MPEHGNTSAPPPAFQPPKGFESAETPSTLSAPLLQPLRPLNLQGKQIWHIIAPANLPMSAVGEIALDKAKEGEPVTSHKGTTYGLKQIDEPENEYEQVLIPNEGGEGLRPGESMFFSASLYTVFTLYLSSKQRHQNNTCSSAAICSRHFIYPKDGAQRNWRIFLPASATIKTTASAEDWIEDALHAIVFRQCLLHNRFF